MYVPACALPTGRRESLKNIVRPVEGAASNTTAVVFYASPLVCVNYTSSSPALVIGNAPLPAQQQSTAAARPTADDDNYYQGIWARYGCFKAATLFADVAAYGGDMKEDDTPKADSVKYPVSEGMKSSIGWRRDVRVQPYQRNHVAH